VTLFSARGSSCQCPSSRAQIAHGDRIAACQLASGCSTVWKSPGIQRIGPGCCTSAVLDLLAMGSRLLGNPGTVLAPRFSLAPPGWPKGSAAREFAALEGGARSPIREPGPSAIIPWGTAGPWPGSLGKGPSGTLRTHIESRYPVTRKFPGATSTPGAFMRRPVALGATFNPQLSLRGHTAYTLQVAATEIVCAAVKTLCARRPDAAALSTETRVFLEQHFSTETNPWEKHFPLASGRGPSSTLRGRAPPLLKTS